MELLKPCKKRKYHEKTNTGKKIKLNPVDAMDIEENITHCTTGMDVDMEIEPEYTCMLHSNDSSICSIYQCTGINSSELLFSILMPNTYKYIN